MDCQSMSFDDLKILAKDLGLSSSGSKLKLCSRIQSFLKFNNSSRSSLVLPEINRLFNNLPEYCTSPVHVSIVINGISFIRTLNNKNQHIIQLYDLSNDVYWIINVLQKSGFIVGYNHRYSNVKNFKSLYYMFFLCDFLFPEISSKSEFKKITPPESVFDSQMSDKLDSFLNVNAGFKCKSVQSNYIVKIDDYNFIYSKDKQRIVIQNDSTDLYWIISIVFYNDIIVKYKHYKTNTDFAELSNMFRIFKDVFPKINTEILY